MPLPSVLRRWFSRTDRGELGNGKPQSLNPESDGFGDWGSLIDSGRTTAAGIPVSHLSALCHPTYWQAVLMLSDDLGCLSFQVLRRNEKKEMIPDRDHPADFLIRVHPSEDKTAFDFWHMFEAHALMWGNAYAFIDRDASGRPVGLMNLLPDRTHSMRDSSGDLFYRTMVDANEIFLRARNVLHIRGLWIDGDEGLDPLVYHRDLIGLGQAGFDYASQFFRRGGRIGGILMIPQHFKEGAAKGMEEGFRKAYEGVGEAFKTVVAREGATFKAGQMSPQESQMIESRLADSRDIARIFKIPAQKLGLPDAVGFRSLEQAQQWYLQQALMPWAKRCMGQCRLRLLSAQQVRSGEYDIGVDISSVLTLDEKSLNEILAIQRQNAVINANEWRARIGMPMREDEASSDYLNPNTTEFDSTGSASDDDNADALEGVVNRMFARVLREAERHAKNPAKFLDWAAGATERHRPVIVDAFTLPARLVSDKPASTAEVWADMFLASTVGTFRAYCELPHAACDLTGNVMGACDHLRGQSRAMALEYLRISNEV